MSESTRVRILALAVLGVVFLGGMVVGVALDRSVAEAAPAALVPNDRVVAPEVSTPLRERGGWVIDQIEVNEDQREDMEAVILRHMDQMSVRVAACEASYQEVIDSARAGIRELLTAEQRAQFDAILAEREAEGRAGEGESGAGRTP